MSEMKGYTCDGGCGATVVLQQASDPLARYGWFTTFTPSGWPTLYTCSSVCLTRALDVQEKALRGLPA